MPNEFPSNSVCDCENSLHRDRGVSDIVNKPCNGLLPHPHSSLRLAYPPQDLLSYQLVVVGGEGGGEWEG